MWNIFQEWLTTGKWQKEPKVRARERWHVLNECINVGLK